MSFDALAWGAKQNTGSAGTKLVLLGLAECAGRGDGLAFPSTDALVEFSSLDRKSVIANLDRLERAGFISDTGQRAGRTKQIKVYRLHLESIPKTEASQKRNSSVFSGKGSQKRDTEPVREPVSSEAKASSPRVKFRAPPGVSDEQWVPFCKQRKKPLNDRAYTLLCNKLLKVSAESGWPPGELIDLANERGWETVFKPRTFDHERANKSSTLDKLITASFGIGAGVGKDPQAGGSGEHGRTGSTSLAHYGGGRA